MGGEAPALRTVSRVQMTLSQALEMGGKRQARVHLAEVLAREAEARRRETERQLLLEVRQAYAELIWAQLGLQLDQQTTALALRQWQLAQGRYKLGDIPLVEVLELEAYHSHRLASLQQAEQEQQSRRANLAGWLGLTASQAEVTGELGSRSDLPKLADLLNSAQQNRPDLLSVQLSRERRLAEVGLEQARGVSDVTVQTGLAYDRTYISPNNIPSNGLTGIGNPVVSLLAGLSIPLPFHDDNSGNIEAAQLRVQAADSEAQALQRQIRAQVESAYWTVLAHQRARQILSGQTVPLTTRALKILEEAYRVRARSLTELLQARQAYLEAARAELEAARQEELALVRLEAATFQNLPR